MFGIEPLIVTAIATNQPYPANPGHKEIGGTSQQAAEEMRVPAETLRDRVLASLKEKPGTADEIAERLGVSILSIRPRVSELGRMGLVTKRNRKRPNASGKLAVVWGAVTQEDNSMF